MEQPNQAKHGTGFEDTARAVGADIVDAIDGAIDRTAKVIGGEQGSRVAGGAAVGALAAIVLPISLVGGALLGAGYAIMRRPDR